MIECNERGSGAAGSEAWPDEMNMNKRPQLVIRKPRCRPLLAIVLPGILLFVGLSSQAIAASDDDAVTLEGTVLMQVVDEFEHGRSHIRYFLRERRSNEQLELKLSPEQAKRVRPGQELKVRGRRRDKVLEADPDADAVAVLTEPAALAAPAATRRVISLMSTSQTEAGHGIPSMACATGQISFWLMKCLVARLGGSMSTDASTTRHTAP